MTDFRKLAFVGLMSLGLATVGSAGCSSSSSSSGTGGSTGTGGSASGTGGSTSHTGGSTGTGGAAGGAATLGCQASDAPTSLAIADFGGGDASLQIMGGFFTYGSTPVPTYTIGSGSVNVIDTL